MISKFVILSIYFLLFFLLARLIDLYVFCFQRSTTSNTRLQSTDLSVKQLKHILDLRGINYANIYEKYELIGLVQQMGSIRKEELFERTENIQAYSTNFSSYKQLVDMVEYCEENIWLIHLIPNEKTSSVILAQNEWLNITRRLAIYGIKTGTFNCVQERNSCQKLSSSFNEQLLLILPNSKHSSSSSTSSSYENISSTIYSYQLLSSNYRHYQHILFWLTKMFMNHHRKENDWYELFPSQTKPRLTLSLTSGQKMAPLFYLTLSIRYRHYMNFIVIEHNNNFSLTFSKNQTSYIYGQNVRLKELFTFESLNLFLSYLTSDLNTIVHFFFYILNLFLLYDLYLITTLKLCLIKKLFIYNFTSLFIWFMTTNYFFHIGSNTLSPFIQFITFQFILLTDQSLVLTKLRNDIQFYKLKTPWILIGISLHVVTGFALKWYETRKRRRENTSTNEEYLQTIPFENSQREDTMNYCTKFWQFFLRILFSDSQQRSPSVVLDYTNDEITNILDYFSHTYTYGSLWLNYSSIPSYGISNNVNNISYLKHLPVWRFGMTRRGVCETFSDIEPENNRQFDDDNDEQRQSSVMSRICNYFNHKRKERKQCRRRKLSTISPMDLRNCYTSESDDNNNTIISRIYQCSICLEKYKYGDYLCSLPCLHNFHQKCLLHWLKTGEHQTCPICRWPAYRLEWKAE